MTLFIPPTRFPTARRAMDLGLVCPEATGHLNPSLTLGRELAGRGHRVRIITTPAAADKIANAGLEHLIIGQPEADDGLIEKATSRLGKLSGYLGLLFTLRLMVAASRMLRRDLPPALKQDPCDALLVDQVCPAGAMIAQELGIPFIVLCNALAVVLDEKTPPATSPWRYSRHPLPRFRNRIGLKIVPPLIDFITGARRDGISAMALCRGNDQSLAIITQQPPRFDFPVPGPAHLRHTGPWHIPTRDDGISFPWDRLDGRPLVYASLGTLQNRSPRLFRAIIDSVRNLDVQLVLALGRRDAAWNELLPDNVLAVPYAPQLRLLARADLAITHAGLNTALECLAAGVPMLCLPITNDQPGVARRVEWTGTGKVLLPRWATPKRLQTLIVELLQNPRYRQAAKRFQTEIANNPGPPRAADLIEQALANGIRKTK